VIGGGRDGVFYVTQLERAIAAGRLVCDSIVVIDRDPGCPVAGVVGPRTRLEMADWSDWLEPGLDALPPGAHLVPYHWAPHLLLTWLQRQLASRGRGARVGGELPAFGTPFEAPTRAGDRALSHATWPCPPACIEPALCPHTRGPRSWSLAADLERMLDAVVFRCLHLVWGVGTIPVADILAARDRLLADPPPRLLVATASHCHGLATSLEVGPRS
jgi:hypothetical protein